MTSTYFYTSDGKTKNGPLGLQQLTELARTGKLKPGDMVCREGDNKWHPAREVPGLFAATAIPVATLVLPGKAPAPGTPQPLRAEPSQAVQVAQQSVAKTRPEAQPSRAEPWSHKIRQNPVLLWSIVGGSAVLLVLAIVVVVVSLSGRPRTNTDVAGVKKAGGDDDSKSASVTAAWEKAGATVEWGQRIFIDSFVDKDKFPEQYLVITVKWKPGVLAGLPPPQTPFALNLSGASNAALKEVARFDKLAFLRLQKASAVSDQGLKALAGLKNLVLVNFEDESKISDNGLKHLAGLAELRALGLASSQVADLGGIGQLKKLKTLDLSHCKISDAAMERVSGLENLEELSLLGTQITDDGVKHLAALKNLKALILAFTNTSDAGVKELAGLTELNRLILWETKVSDAGLEHLKDLKKLQIITVTKTLVTAAGVEKLRRSLPEVKIFD